MDEHDDREEVVETKPTVHISQRVFEANCPTCGPMKFQLSNVHRAPKNTFEYLVGWASLLNIKCPLCNSVIKVNKLLPPGAIHNV